MAIPAQQIGWSQRAKLLWYISKQMQQLNGVLYNGGTPTTTTTTTTAAPSLWSFVPGESLVWPLTQTGYTLYEGAWTAFDDGDTVDMFSFVDTLYTGGNPNITYVLSTNGYIQLIESPIIIYGNQQDLYLTPGQPLSNGDIQNFWYQNSGNAAKWKTSILVYCGHCCNSPATEEPYSYILNIYRDSEYQYIETRVQSNSNGTAGPEGYVDISDIESIVWRSDLLGTTWENLGFGLISN